MAAIIGDLFWLLPIYKDDHMECKMEFPGTDFFEWKFCVCRLSKVHHYPTLYVQFIKGYWFSSCNERIGLIDFKYRAKYLACDILG